MLCEFPQLNVRLAISRQPLRDNAANPTASILTRQ
jgi:hypothetical protein